MHKKEDITDDEAILALDYYIGHTIREELSRAIKTGNLSPERVVQNINTMLVDDLQKRSSIIFRSTMNQIILSLSEEKEKEN